MSVVANPVANPVASAPAPSASATNAPPAAASSAPAPMVSATQALSLYVGDLAPDCTEANLYEKFSEAGPVASIRVCRDATTRRSLGYAYINYSNPDHANFALENFNFQPMRGRPMRVCKSMRDPSKRKDVRANVFIKNLDKTINDRELFDTFSAFGEILSSKVVKDVVTGESLGFAFVHYTTEEEANSAIEKVNGMLLKDMKVYVGKFVPRKAAAGGAQRQFTNVFVKNLPDSINTDEKLRELFAPFGETLSVKLLIAEASAEGEEAKSKGSGFVNFKEPEDAVKAVDEINDKEIDGKTVYAGRAQKRAERQKILKKEHERRNIELQSKTKGRNLYVKNLDEDITEEKLRAAFAEYGTITSCKVVKDKNTQLPRGFGFVCFFSPDEATKAVTEMNGKIDIPAGISKPLYVALAERKEERAARLEGQYQSRITQQQQIPQGGMMYGQPGMMSYAMQGMPMQQGRFYQSRPRFQQQMYPGMGGQYGMPMPRQRHMNQGKPRVAAPVMNMPQPQARAQEPQRQQQQQQQQPQAANPPAAAPPLTASALASASVDQQKQMLGEALYPAIMKAQPELAGKITGMLLEMDNSELLHLLEDNSALLSKVQEAVQVLEAHSSKN